MGLLDRGAAAHIRRKKQSDGRSVTYTRLAGGSITLTMWLGSQLFSRTTEEPGASVVWGDRDYLCEVEDLAVGGVPFDPAEGDRITETIAGVAVTFELQTPTGEPPYRHSDATRTMWRFHTKRV